MVNVPDRLAELREKRLSGPLLPEDITRAEQLITLDFAVMNREYAAESLTQQEEADNGLGSIHT
jgi:hypothetical protein